MIGQRLVLSFLGSTMLLATNVAREGVVAAGLAIPMAIPLVGCANARSTEDVVTEHREKLLTFVAEIESIVKDLPSAPVATRLMRLDGRPVPSAGNTVLVAAEDVDVARIGLGPLAAWPWSWTPSSRSTPRAASDPSVREVVDALRASPAALRNSRPHVVQALEADMARVLFARYVAIVRSERDALGVGAMTGVGRPSVTPPPRWSGKVALFDRFEGRWVGSLVVELNDDGPAGEGPGSNAQPDRGRATEVEIERAVRATLAAGWTQPAALSAGGSTD